MNGVLRTPDEGSKSKAESDNTIAQRCDFAKVARMRTALAVAGKRIAGSKIENLAATECSMTTVRAVRIRATLAKSQRCAIVLSLSALDLLLYPVALSGVSTPFTTGRRPGGGPLPPVS